MADKRNCKDYCRFRRCCYAKGEPGLDPDDCPTAWKIEDILNDYNKNMLPLAGDYYQGTTGWAEARTNWWNMLQEVGASDGSIEAITEIVNTRCDMANGK